MKQNEQLMEMIDKGADVVFLTASDPDAVTPALEALDKADIPVILLETQVKERDLAKAFSVRTIIMQEKCAEKI